MRCVAMVLGLGVVAVASAQTPGPSIRYAVLEACIRQLHADGVISSYPDVEFGWRPPSRYEYAVDANAAFIGLNQASKGFQDVVRRPAFLRPGSREAAMAINLFDRERASLLNLSKDLSITKMLFRTFGKELADLGVDTKGASYEFALIQSRLNAFRHSPIPKVGESLEPFADVPADHWASVATTNLRREGILSGYGDGKFGG